MIDGFDVSGQGYGVAMLKKRHLSLQPTKASLDQLEILFQTVNLYLHALTYLEHDCWSQTVSLNYITLAKRVLNVVNVNLYQETYSCKGMMI